MIVIAMMPTYSGWAGIAAKRACGESRNGKIVHVDAQALELLGRVETCRLEALRLRPSHRMCASQKGSEEEDRRLHGGLMIDGWEKGDHGEKMCGKQHAVLLFFFFCCFFFFFSFVFLVLYHANGHD